MGIIFGKKKAVSRITQQDKAVLQLKQQRDKLKVYQKRIERALEADRTLAKRLLSDGHKERAKLLLRKKRYQEQLLQRTDGQLDNLQRLTEDIEYAQVELQVVNGLKTGNDALKTINDTLNITDIEKILDETREGIEKQKEIDELLHGALSEDDEIAVDEEFAQLIAENLPELPKDKVPTNERNDDESVEIASKLPDVPMDIPLAEKREKKPKTKVSEDAVPLEA